MSSRAGALEERVDTPGARAGRLIDCLGGRYSREIGIDVDAGDPEVERWFVAATLFGSRISASAAKRTFGVLESAGIGSIADVQRFSWEELVALLDQGGYARYDFRMATRLRSLADVVAARYGGGVAALGQMFSRYPALREALDALPGWGPVTVQVFLRELRSVWPGARPPLDERTQMAARHLGLIDARQGRPTLSDLSRVATRARLDPRDLESALVRLALAHHGRWDTCPGGSRCAVLAPR